jgi:hypothetical protein
MQVETTSYTVKTRQRIKGALGTLDHLYKAQTISN